MALQILRQLKEPKAQLQSVGLGEYKDRSLILPVHLSTLDGKINVLESDGLLDCDTSGRCLGYIDSKFVADLNLPTTPLPPPIAVYNVDNSLNHAGAITCTCTLDMRIADHVQHIEFRITNTGSSNVILGLGWLRHHNPLVDWKLGQVFFTRCPLECGVISPNPPVPPLNCSSSSDASATDVHSIRCSREYPCPTDNEIEAEWWEILCRKLHGDGESMLCVDLNARVVRDPTDPRVLDHLRQAKESATGLDKYLKEFASVFAKAEFDQLPPKRPWDHANELKPDAKPISSKIYPLSRLEQTELDKFI